MPQETYVIPAKPKTDAEFLEVIGKVIFVMRFSGIVVEKRWPQIKKAFHNFDVDWVSKATLEKLIDKPGMIRNKMKINNIIENAKICQNLITEHSSMKKWVANVQKKREESIIFNPTLKEECKQFKGIGETTSGWLDYVFMRAKSKPQTIKRGESPE